MLVALVGLSSCDSTGPDGVARVEVTLSRSAASYPAGDTVRAHVTAFAADGTVTASPRVVWRSTNTAVATVDGSGLVRAMGNGSAAIEADVGGVVGSAAIEVLGTLDSPGPDGVARVEVTLSPSAPSHPAGDTLRARVTAFAADGTVTASPRVVWRSTNTAVATVDGSGLVRAMGNGSAAIEADVDGVVGSAAIEVLGTLHRRILDSETWTVAGSPHFVQGLIHVQGSPAPIVLTIEPGSTVRFRDESGLDFGSSGLARLVVPAGEGRVRMEGDSTGFGTWVGLRFHGPQTSELRRVTLSHCGQDDPDGGRPACLSAWPGVPGAAPVLLLDDVLIDSAGGAGLTMGVWTAFAPGSRDLVIRRTDDTPVVLPPDLVAAFPGADLSESLRQEIEVSGGGIRESTTWPKLGVPLRLTEEILVAADFGDPEPTLTISAGSTILADPMARFRVEGRLEIGATGAEPTSIRASGAEGWPGIDGGSLSLRNVRLSGCGSWGACVETSEAIFVDDVVISESLGDGVRIGGHAPFAEGSRDLVIHSSAGAPLRLSGSGVGSIPSGRYTGNGFDAIVVEQAGVDGVSTWLDRGVPFAAPAGIEVLGTLTIADGVKVLMGGGTSVSVDAEGASLRVQGTAERPVVFTALDGDIPGSWTAIRLGRWITPSTRFEHLEVLWAGRGPEGMAAAITMEVDPGALIRSTRVAGSATCGVLIWFEPWTDDYTDPAFENTFTELGDAPRCGPFPG